MKRLRKTIIAALILALCLTSIPFYGRNRAKAADVELDKVVFDGDSAYDWSHFYSVNGKTATIADLNITVLDKTGATVPADAYTLETFATWWDNAQDKEMQEAVTAPYGIKKVPDGSDGFCEYICKVTAKEGSGYTGEIQGTFHIMDKYCMEWICAETKFESARMEGWRMCDRFIVDLGKLKAPTVTANDGTKLTEGKDYKLEYFTRMEADLDSFETDRDKVLKGVEKLAGLPTKPGGYVVKMTGISPYYGGTTILLDVNDDGTSVAQPEPETPEVGTTEPEKPEEKPTEKVKVPKTTLAKAAVGKKYITVKWKAPKIGDAAVKITGYEIRYSTNKNFKANVKTIKIKDGSKLKRKIGKLASGKTYYISIRTVVTVGSEKIYSDWSKKIKVKTK